MKLFGVIALCVLFVGVCCQDGNGTDVPTPGYWPTYPSPDPTTGPTDDYPTTPLPPIIINGTDGALCDTNHTLAWLDLVIVLESTSATASQWQAIVGNILTYLTQLPLSNSGNVAHTSRVAIITYDSSSNPVQQYQFSDRQDVRGIQFALNAAKPNTTSSKGNIASGLRAANDYLNSQSSFRVKGVILYAATYDDSGTNNPVEAANELKADLIKIATISYDAANGVNTPRINALSSPGLALTSLDDIKSFATIISQLNCRCPAGWTQLAVNNTISYADCFFYQDTNNLQAFTECGDNNILAVVNTKARRDFIGLLVTNGTDTPTDTFSVGLTRSDPYSPWLWANGQYYTDTLYPPFVQSPATSDVYGYLSKKDTYNWQLYSDDGMTNSRYYVCQKRSCDTANICDLTGN